MNLKEALEIISNPERQHYEVLRIPNVLWNEMDKRNLIGCYPDGCWGLTDRGSDLLYLMKYKD